MKKEKRWKVAPKRGKDVFEQIVLNRGISDLDKFINPPSPKETLEAILRENISLKRGIVKATELVFSAINNNSPIYIHGDYDADGICSTAILWERIYYGLNYKNCFPYIPDRFSEGYGLSRGSVDSIFEKLPEGATDPVIITVDCGITSRKEVAYAKSKGFKVIISDHHQKGKVVPKADAILWTDKLCGAGIAWALSCELNGKEVDENALDLVALATIADIQPLVGYNRSLVKYGLEELGKLKRAGLYALANMAGIAGKKIGVYEVGWVVAPRINAAGRVADALDSLRLLCAKSAKLAETLAKKVNEANLKRQGLTHSMFEKSKASYKRTEKIIVSESGFFHEGIIGLVAGKLVSEYHRPAIVISKKEGVSKGSARSVAGVNIIGLLRHFSGLFESLGGHPMAAGFSVRNDNLDKLVEKLYRFSADVIKDSDIIPEIAIDAEIRLEDAAYPLLDFLMDMEPFGFGNREPVFLTRGVKVRSAKKVGKNGEHLRLVLIDSKGALKSGIAFGFGGLSIGPGSKLDVVYTLGNNVWKGKRMLDLRIKDVSF